MIDGGRVTMDEWRRNVEQISSQPGTVSGENGRAAKAQGRQLGFQWHKGLNECGSWIPYFGLTVVERISIAVQLSDLIRGCGHQPG